MWLISSGEQWNVTWPCCHDSSGIVEPRVRLFGITSQQYVLFPSVYYLIKQDHECMHASMALHCAYSVIKWEHYFGFGLQEWSSVKQICGQHHKYDSMMTAWPQGPYRHLPGNTAFLGMGICHPAPLTLRLYRGKVGNLTDASTGMSPMQASQYIPDKSQRLVVFPHRPPMTYFCRSLL